MILRKSPQIYHKAVSELPIIFCEGLRRKALKNFSNFERNRFQMTKSSEILPKIEEIFESFSNLQDDNREKEALDTLKFTTQK
jgi:hypothetical protein